jgi:hypothetical protein
MVMTSPTVFDPLRLSLAPSANLDPNCLDNVTRDTVRIGILYSLHLLVVAKENGCDLRPEIPNGWPSKGASCCQLSLDAVAMKK